MSALLSIVALLGLPCSRAAFAQGRGGMVVLSTTSGADILVDGKLVATVPRERPIVLRAGPHEIRVELRGYSAYVDTVQIVAGQELMLEADLIAHSGIVMVETPGVTAHVFVDGADKGPTPFDGEVTIGARDIEVRAPGHIAFRTRLTVKGGQLYPISVELERDPNAVAVAARPPVSPLAEDGGKSAWYGNVWVVVGAGAVLVGVGGWALATSVGGEEQPPNHATIRLLDTPQK